MSARSTIPGIPEPQRVERADGMALTLFNLKNLQSVGDNSKIMPKPTFISLKLLLTGLLFVICHPLKAYDGEDFTFNGINYTVISEQYKTCKTKEGSYNYDTYTYTSGQSNYPEEIALPQKPNGYYLSEIGNYSFCICDKLTSITIPEGVTKIGEHAFEKSTKISSIILPESVTLIGAGAFERCSNLKFITLPPKLTKISEYTFYDCSSLESLIIPDRVTFIDYHAFMGCSSLTTISLPYGLTEIRIQTFSKCKSLKEIVIPEGVRKIDGGAFEYCSSLNSITLPKGLTEIGNGSFIGCASLSSIILPQELKRIESEAFVNCTALSSVNIPPSLTYFGDGAFKNCSSLRWLIIPSMFNCSWGRGVFSGCTLNPLILEYIPSEPHILSGLNSESLVLCPHESDVAYFKKAGYTNLDIRVGGLELKTQNPKCVAEGCAIITAETNIPDFESGAGFEWKKYDAPPTLIPSSSKAVIYDGRMEGYIKNLQSSSYYDVRAFFKNDSGQSWYGDWVTFDPSDFSFFEPIVHTFYASNVTSKSAIVKGYIIPGTSPIESQGFQYWETTSPEIKHLTHAENDLTTIISTGSDITTIFEGLKPETQYTFRAFAETKQGYIYGYEEIFTTKEDTSGIEDITDNNNDDVNIVGYFNTFGIRSEKPYKGINIVVYSDGTSRKIIYK